ncbi:PIN domain-containing protein [Thermococcus sp.]|uniref:PIN domain-containing protein n=1 Tax=Thermococcus sp. TaxID=35749 RepID=UPI002622FCF7|nr:PIN domain-containing protein [Thermococcus sp.]
MAKAKIRVVLDTSILVSALKSKNPRRSPSWRILKALVSGEIENYISREIYFFLLKASSFRAGM